ncbi:MAG TPA: chemotaxis protein CheW, partial [Ignavibacteriales bacterium]|nr:chemotaxis protein CheW [Ignavibacteriales bacterium]
MNNNVTITETRPYLTFKLDNEMFAIDVSQVREILNYMTITKMPQMPDFMKGVINLRGSVVPVIDMRKKFGLDAKETDKDMVIVVMEIRFEQETAV